MLLNIISLFLCFILPSASIASFDDMPTEIRVYHIFPELLSNTLTAKDICTVLRPLVLTNKKNYHDIKLFCTLIITNPYSLDQKLTSKTHPQFNVCRVAYMAKMFGTLFGKSFFDAWLKQHPWEKPEKYAKDLSIIKKSYNEVYGTPYDKERIPRLLKTHLDLKEKCSSSDDYQIIEAMLEHEIRFQNFYNIVLLLNNGGKANTNDVNHLSPLYTATVLYPSNFIIGQLLIDYGADVNAFQFRLRKTLLSCIEDELNAARTVGYSTRLTEIKQFLIKNGAKPNTQSNKVQENKLIY